MIYKRKEIPKKLNVDTLYTGRNFYAYCDLTFRGTIYSSLTLPFLFLSEGEKLVALGSLHHQNHRNHHPTLLAPRPESKLIKTLCCCCPKSNCKH